ncbi:MAG TPA: hypothetical protein VNE39_03425 [Planctomycetota bacterium]|nr:hypothetical protein [Planctomycetota bacterium]
MSVIARLQCALVILLATGLPARAAVTVIGGLTHERVVEPGKTYTGAIVVRNLGKTPEDVKIYLTDYRFTSDGKVFYDEPAGNGPRSSGKWVTLNRSILSIPPGESTNVSYSVAVPNDGSLKGTYWCVVMVEGMGPSVAPNAPTEKGKVGMGIRQVFRHAIQVVSHVGNSGERKMKMDARLAREGQKRLLQIDVVNTGERWLRPRLSAQLFGAEGQAAGKFEAGGVRVYPGTSARRSVDISAVAPGMYRALVVADAGDDDVYGVTYTLTLEGEKKEQVKGGQ